MCHPNTGSSYPGGGARPARDAQCKPPRDAPCTEPARSRTPLPWRRHSPDSSLMPWSAGQVPRARQRPGGHGRARAATPAPLPRPPPPLRRGGSRTALGRRRGSPGVSERCPGAGRGAGPGGRGASRRRKHGHVVLGTSGSRDRFQVSRTLRPAALPPSGSAAAPAALPLPPAGPARGSWPAALQAGRLHARSLPGKIRPPGAVEVTAGSGRSAGRRAPVSPAHTASRPSAGPVRTGSPRSRGRSAPHSPRSGPALASGPGTARHGTARLGSARGGHSRAPGRPLGWLRTTGRSREQLFPSKMSGACAGQPAPDCRQPPLPRCLRGARSAPRTSPGPQQAQPPSSAGQWHWGCLRARDGTPGTGPQGWDPRDGTPGTGPQGAMQEFGIGEDGTRSPAPPSFAHSPQHTALEQSLQREHPGDGRRRHRTGTPRSVPDPPLGPEPGLEPPSAAAAPAGPACENRPRSAGRGAPPPRDAPRHQDGPGTNPLPPRSGPTVASARPGARGPSRAPPSPAPGPAAPARGYETPTAPTGPDRTARSPSPSLGPAAPRPALLRKADGVRDPGPLGPVRSGPGGDDGSALPPAPTCGRGGGCGPKENSKLAGGDVTRRNSSFPEEKNTGTVTEAETNGEAAPGSALELHPSDAPKRS
uniref:collagen alpha-1(I) chain-like n=1 Tax=Lonchura striata TaxID=40157 RepID=UPI000B4CF729|nr:collagen alpha-1(I) chain-like [Lonchura striata domestica]